MNDSAVTGGYCRTTGRKGWLTSNAPDNAEVTHDRKNCRGSEAGRGRMGGRQKVASRLKN